MELDAYPTPYEKLSTEEQEKLQQAKRENKIIQECSRIDWQWQEFLDDDFLINYAYRIKE